MKNTIKLTEIFIQQWTTFLGYNISRKPTKTGEVYLDTSKIVTYQRCGMNEDSILYRDDFQELTYIKLVGGGHICVTELPSQIEQLINKKY